MEHNVTSALNCRDVEGQVVAPRRRRKNGARDIAAAFKGRGELLPTLCKDSEMWEVLRLSGYHPSAPIMYGRGYSRTTDQQPMVLLVC